MVENIQATQVHFQIKKSSALLSPFSSNDNILYGSVTTPPTTSSSIVYALSGEEKAYHRLGAWQRPFRAYIIRATALGHAPSFSIKPTGIVSPQLSTKNTWNTPIFDLTGRRISTPKSGQILIEGGRKVMH